MRKRIALIMALILFVLVLIPPVSAIAFTQVILDNAPVVTDVPDVESGGVLEKLLASIINGISTALRATGLMPISTMLYNVDPVVTDQEWIITQSSWNRWMLRDSQWMQFAMPAYRAFTGVAFGLLLITFISGGMKLSIHSGSPQARAKAANNVLFWLIGGVLFMALPALINLLIDFNMALVSVAGGLVGEDIIRTMDARLFGPGLQTGNILLTALVNLALVVFMLWFNVIFFIRWFVVTALFSIAPLSIWTWMKGQQSSFFLWLGELISNILMQFAYALVFGMALLVLTSPGLERNWLINLTALTMVIPVTKLLRTMITQWLNIIGLDEEGQARSVVGGGIGSLAAVGGALAGTRSGGGSGSRGASGGAGAGGLSVASAGGGGGDSGGAGAGTDAGGGTFASRVFSGIGQTAVKAASFGAGALTAGALAPVTGWGDAGNIGKRVAGGAQKTAATVGGYARGASAYMGNQQNTSSSSNDYGASENEGDNNDHPGSGGDTGWANTNSRGDGYSNNSGHDSSEGAPYFEFIPATAPYDAPLPATGEQEPIELSEEFKALIGYKSSTGSTTAPPNSSPRATGRQESFDFGASSSYPETSRPPKQESTFNPWDRPSQD